MSTLRWINTLLSLIVMCASICSAQQTSPASQDVNKAVPSFQASGIEGNTAPSGYSAGASEEQIHQVSGLVAQLQKESLAALVPAATVFTCDRQAALNQAALAQPASFEANHNLGLFYFQHGEPQPAARYLQLAAEIQPRNRDNLLQLAIADLQLQQYTGASHVARTLLQENSDDAAAHNILGIVDAGVGKPRDALVKLKRSLELDPNEDATFAAGLTMLSSGSLADAESTFLTGTSLHPDSANLWLGRGLAESLNGMRSQSIASLLKASALDPANLLPYTLLASQSGGAPATDEKITMLLEQLVKKRPDQAITHYDYALALFKRNEGSRHGLPFQQIESELKIAIDEQPQLAAAHYQLGLVYSETGTNAHATAELALANLIEPGVAEWHYRLARAYRKNQQISAADQQMQIFIQLKTRRDAGDDVSANLTAGLASAIQQISATCELLHP